MDATTKAVSARFARRRGQTHQLLSEHIELDLLFTLPAHSHPKLLAECGYLGTHLLVLRL